MPRTPVTNYGPGHGVSSLHQIYNTLQKKKDKFKFSHQQSTFSGQFKMEINHHLVKHLATKNFNILFSLTIVIFPLGQYYISF